MIHTIVYWLANYMYTWHACAMELMLIIIETAGEMLTDKHISFAHRLLHRPFLDYSQH